MGRGWVCFGLSLLLGACGGRSERHEGGDDGAASPSTKGEEPGGDDDDDVPGNEVTLPGCDLGPADRGAMGADCMWLAEGRCYADKLEACACICPLDHESICSSGFPSDSGRTPVYCN